jgi:glycosyltransferase involved in cell wall biosynthesis
MKVLHVIPSLSPKHGGPSVALPLMARALESTGVEVSVATTDDDGPGARISAPIGTPVVVAGSTRYYFRRQVEVYKYSHPLALWLTESVAKFDVVHVHALFSHASVAGARAARRARVPYVVRPLGVLGTYGMSRRRPLLKRLSFRWIERKLLRDAAAIQYTSESEKLEAEQQGVIGASVVIPLGLDLAAFDHLPGREAFLQRWPSATGRKVVLFLSRIDPKKGLDLLLEAFVEVKRMEPRALLAIGGAGDLSVVEALRRKAQSLGLADDVLWLGFLDESMKLEAFGGADAFVLPSLSENFGIAAVEALAAGLPSVLTEGVGVAREVAAAKAGLVVSGEPSAVATALLRILGEDGLAEALSRNAQVLVREGYSLEAMGLNLKRLYDDILARHRGRLGASS